MGLNHNDLRNRFVHRARLVLNDAQLLAKKYNGCFRINLGCPRATLL